jgi:hypothetical protein
MTHILHTAQRCHGWSLHTNVQQDKEGGHSLTEYTHRITDRGGRKRGRGDLPVAATSPQAHLQRVRRRYVGWQGGWAGLGLKGLAEGAAQRCTLVGAVTAGRCTAEFPMISAHKKGFRGQRRSTIGPWTGNVRSLS